MSQTRLNFDDCYYDDRVKLSTAVSNYMLNPCRNSGVSKCRARDQPQTLTKEKGDFNKQTEIESNLVGRYRKATKCPYTYRPTSQSLKCISNGFNESCGYDDLSDLPMCGEQFETVSSLASEPKVNYRSLTVDRFIYPNVDASRTVWYPIRDDFVQNTRLMVKDNYRSSK